MMDNKVIEHDGICSGRDAETSPRLLLKIYAQQRRTQ